MCSSIGIEASRSRDGYILRTCTGYSGLRKVRIEKFLELFDTPDKVIGLSTAISSSSGDGGVKPCQERENGETGIALGVYAKRHFRSPPRGSTRVRRWHWPLPGPDKHGDKSVAWSSSCHLTEWAPPKVEIRPSIYFTFPFLFCHVLV